MKGGLKKFATAALALAAIGVGAPQPQGVGDRVESSNSRTHTNNPVQKTGIQMKDKGGTNFVRTHAGGLNIWSHDPGIPPHIYGAHFVRRGTHKKTNKRS